jgi:hypothetical protein
VLETTGTLSGTATTSATPIGIADNQGTSPMTGYLSNVRVNLGSTSAALPYTANFTPSTSPLTAVTGTQLLTCQSNRFVDNSTNALSIPISGSPSVQRFSPFAPLTVYNPTTYGGSAYFDGDDRLVLPAQSSMTGDFTVEFYFYITGRGLGDPTFISNWPVAGTAGNVLVIQMSGVSTTVFALYVGSVSGSGNLAFSASTSVYNQWNHIAVTRSGSSMACFLNGVRVSTSTNSNTITLPANTAIGSYTNGDGGGNYFQGYISNLRIVNGTSVYNPSLTTCTVPTTPLTPTASTQLLLSNTNAGILDNSMMNDLETVGNAAVSTSVKKYGAASMVFDGTGDYLVSTSTNNPIDFGTGDFTIEFWLYLNSTGTQVIFDGRNSSASDVAPMIYYLSGLKYYTTGNDRITGGTLSTGQWYYITLVKASGSTKLYINGTQTGSTYTDGNTYVQQVNRPVVGAEGVTLGNSALNGYIDDLRITKYARYTTTFTVPDQAFPNG